MWEGLDRPSPCPALQATSPQPTTPTFVVGASSIYAAGGASGQAQEALEEVNAFRLLVAFGRLLALLLYFRGCRGASNQNMGHADGPVLDAGYGVGWGSSCSLMHS